MIRYKLGGQSGNDLRFLWTELASLVATHYSQGDVFWGHWIPGGDRKVLFWQTQQSMIEALGTMTMQGKPWEFTPNLDLITNDDSDTRAIMWDTWGDMELFEHIAKHHKYIIIAPSLEKCFSGRPSPDAIYSHLEWLKEWSERTNKYVILVNGNGSAVTESVINSATMELGINSLWDITRGVHVDIYRPDHAVSLQIRKEENNLWERR